MALLAAWRRQGEFGSWRISRNFSGEMGKDQVEVATWTKTILIQRDIINSVNIRNSESLEHKWYGLMVKDKPRKV